MNPHRKRVSSKKTHPMLYNLVCTTCKSTTKKSIFVTMFGNHTCKKCTKKMTTQTTSIENFLQGAKCPCTYHTFGCKEYDTLSSIKQHEKTCKFGNRCFCKQLVGNQVHLFEHLKKMHSMPMVKLYKPDIDISVRRNDLVLSNYYLACLHAGQTKLILFVQHLSADKIFNVWVSHVGEVVRRIKYMIDLCGDGVYCKYGNVTDKFMDPAAQTTLVVLNKQEYLSFKIYFDNYWDFVGRDKKRE